MNKQVKLTLENLVAKKIEREEKQVKFREIEVPSLGGTLMFEKPSDEDIFDAYDQLEGKEEDLRTMNEVFSKLIYRSCATLRNPKLREELGVKDPFEVVPTLLELKDRIEIGPKLFEMCGLKNEEVVKK